MQPPVIILGVAVAVGLAIAIFRWIRSRPAPEEPVYYHKCAHCRRKLRYRAKQIGRKGMCPQCRNQFVFPTVPGAPPAK
jgi:hypothetical protein